MASSSRTRRVLLGLAIIPLASAVGLELGSRLIDRARGKPWEVRAGRAAIEQVCLMLSRRNVLRGEKPEPGVAKSTILQPYTAWEHPRTQKLIAADGEYYRRPESERVDDIYILGGSVAQGFAQLGAERLVQGLRRDPRFRDREVRVHDYACAGFKEPQQAMVLSYLLALGHKPDAVINLDGFNEAALGWNNARMGTNPLYPNAPAWASATNGAQSDWGMIEHLHAIGTSQDRARAFGEWILESGLWKSCFLYHSLSLRLESLRRDYVGAYRSFAAFLKNRPRDPETMGPRFDEDPQAIAGAIVSGWEETSISMRGMCAVRGITYLHVLQPTLHDEGSKPLTRKEIDGATDDANWIEGVEKVYPRLREAGARLAARGVPFFDASGIFRGHPEDLYIDGCHFAERGNEILADAVADALLQARTR